MKMFMIIYGEAADGAAVAVLKEAGVRGYAKRVQGKGGGDGDGAEAGYARLTRQEQRTLDGRGG